MPAMKIVGIFFKKVLSILYTNHPYRILSHNNEKQFAEFDYGIFFNFVYN